MSCPFYAHNLAHITIPDTRDKWVFNANDGSNQCALITDAHSPCIMQDGPRWEDCSRNPRGDVFCYACGGRFQHSRVETETFFEGLPVKYKYLVRECGNCGLKVTGSEKEDAETSAVILALVTDRRRLLRQQGGRNDRKE